MEPSGRTRMRPGRSGAGPGRQGGEQDGTVNSLTDGGTELGHELRLATGELALPAMEGHTAPGRVALDEHRSEFVAVGETVRHEDLPEALASGRRPSCRLAQQADRRCRASKDAELVHVFVEELVRRDLRQVLVDVDSRG